MGCKNKKVLIDQSALRPSINLKDSFRKVSVVFLCDLSFVRWPVKDGRVVVHIIHVNHDLGVVLVQVIRSHESELVLRRRVEIGIELSVRYSMGNIHFPNLLVKGFIKN
jgi:hypothetical protein